MKRHLHPLDDKSITIWQKICSMDNLKLAHKNAKRGKGWYTEVQIVDRNPDFYLKKLQDMLINKTYHTSKYQTFIKKDGKKERTIYKLPYFPDRICQWAILQVIEPILIKSFIYDTYSAIPGRGIHKCANKIKRILYNDQKGTKYCLKLDVHHYYPSINHDILKQSYQNLFKDNDLLWILNEIIDSLPDSEGIPIGNYLSQYSGNFYLSDFDHWIKEKKQVKYYFRYMDDIVILASSKEELRVLFNEIQAYLTDKLKLEIKNNWQIFPTATRGIDFVGYRFFPGYTLLRKGTLKGMKKEVKVIYHQIKIINEVTLHNRCSLGSYRGWLKYCDSYKLNRKYVFPIVNFLEVQDEKVRKSRKYSKT